MIVWRPVSRCARKVEEGALLHYLRTISIASTLIQPRPRLAGVSLANTVTGTNLE